MADSTDEIITCLKTEPETLFEVVKELNEKLGQPPLPKEVFSLNG